MFCPASAEHLIFHVWNYLSRVCSTGSRRIEMKNKVIFVFVFLFGVATKLYCWFLCFKLLFQLTVKLVLKEWQFADGSHSSNGLPMSSQPSLNGTSSFLPRTGRKIYVTIVEGKDLPSKDKYGKLGSGCYVKFQYGKVYLLFCPHRTRHLKYHIQS